MIALDTDTVIISAGAISICIGLVMFAFIKQGSSVRIHWCLALIFYGISSLLIGFRAFLPPWLANVIANMIAGLSSILIHRGAMVLIGKRPPDWLYVISIIVLGSIYYQYTYLTPNVGIRLFTISMFRAVYFTVTAWYLYNSIQIKSLFGTRALIWMFLVSACWYIFRGNLALSSEEWAVILRTGFLQSVNFMIASAINILMAFALYHVDSEQANRRASDLALKLQLQTEGLESLVMARTQELEQEITDRRRADDALKEEHKKLLVSEQKFVRTFDQAPIGASIVSLEGTYLRANRELESITGFSEKELQSKYVVDITHPDDRARTKANARRLLDGEIAQAEEIKRYIRRDGSAIWVQVSIRLVKDDDGNALFFLPMMVDVTEKLKAEQGLRAAKEQAEQALEDLLVTQSKLVQAEKLASLGQLVAGAAHEINTPLGVSLTIGTLLFDKFNELTSSFYNGNLRRNEMGRFIDETREGYDLLIANLHRAAELMQSFKQVASDQICEERRRFVLNRCIIDTVETLGPVWRRPGHRIDINCPIDIDIDGYPGVISQILTNLITNSTVHGFEQGYHGTIIVSVTEADIDIIQICYTDNGKGIASSVKDKVFEPFYTTKRGSGSTGLGLHIVYNLVVGKLNGSIDLESNDGHGVRFIIRFPRLPVSNPPLT